MGIDLIEDSELAALSSNRVSSFVDENNNYFDFTHESDEDYEEEQVNFSELYEADDEESEGYANILGIGKKKAFNRQVESSVASITYQLDPFLQNSCFYLKDKLNALNNQIQAAVANGASSATLNPMRNFESQLKTLIAQNKCDEKSEEERTAKQKAEALKEQELATVKATQLAMQLQAQSPPEQGSNMNKYIIIGVGAVVVLTAVAILLKKS